MEQDKSVTTNEGANWRSCFLFFLLSFPHTRFLCDSARKHGWICTCVCVICVYFFPFIYKKYIYIFGGWRWILIFTSNHAKLGAHLSCLPSEAKGWNTAAPAPPPFCFPPRSPLPPLLKFTPSISPHTHAHTHINATLLYCNTCDPNGAIAFHFFVVLVKLIVFAAVLGHLCDASLRVHLRMGGNKNTKHSTNFMSFVEALLYNYHDYYLAYHLPAHWSGSIFGIAWLTTYKSLSAALWKHFLYVKKVKYQM